MDVELLEFRDFLSEHQPFDRLPAALLDTLPAMLSIRYLRRGAAISAQEAGADVLSMVRAGAVELCAETGELLARLGEGELFGPGTPLSDGVGHPTARALEDCLLYRLPAERIAALCATSAPLARWFASTPAERLRVAGDPSWAGESAAAGSRMTTPLVDLMTATPVALPPHASVREAAERMSEHGVSSLLVIDGSRLVGILTDRDLRLRVVVQGHSCDTPLLGVMTPEPVTVPREAIACDALLIMARLGVHHLPVVADDRVVGVISSSDLVERRATSPIRLAGTIRRCPDTAQLAHAVAGITETISGLVDAAVPSSRAARLIAGVGDALTVRQLELAEQELGAAPVRYGWVALGVQGRREPCAASHPSVALILDEAYAPERHQAYLQALTRQVAARLHEAGAPFALAAGEGGVALDTVSGWLDTLAFGVTAGDATGLVTLAAWLDGRLVHGHAELHDSLAAALPGLIDDGPDTVDRLARAALDRVPPLGVFRDAVVLADGCLRDHLDLSADALLSIVDLARAHAPMPGGDTPSRLAVTYADDEGHGLLEVAVANDLLVAHGWLGDLRLRHQARQVREGEAAGATVAPHRLSRWERAQLRDAFEIVRRAHRQVGARLEERAAHVRPLTTPGDTPRAGP